MRQKLNRTTIRNLTTKPERYEVSDVDMPALRLRITPNGIKTFILRYRNAAGAMKVFTIGRFGELTPEQAREIAGRKLAEVKLGQDPAAEKQAVRAEAERKQYATLGGFLDLKYAPWVKAHRKTGDGLVARITSCFADFLLRELPDINAWVIEKWRKERLESGIKIGTVNRDISSLKACMSRAVEWGVIDKHPLVAVKPKREDRSGVVRYLDPCEEGRLRDALNARDREIREGRERGNAWRAERGQDPMPALGRYADHLTPMVLVSINTGLRRGELFNLVWSDIALTAPIPSLTVRGEGAKSATTRHVPLNPEAVAVLTTWLEQQANKTGLVFKNADGERFNNTKRSWASLLADARIESFRWHDMRHHFASRLVMAGVDLNTVRELLGHSDLKMTLRYAHLAPSHKAEAVGRLVWDDRAAANG